MCWWWCGKINDDNKIHLSIETCISDHQLLTLVSLFSFPPPSLPPPSLSLSHWPISGSVADVAVPNFTRSSAKAVTAEPWTKGEERKGKRQRETEREKEERKETIHKQNKSENKLEKNGFRSLPLPHSLSPVLITSFSVFVSFLT